MKTSLPGTLIILITALACAACAGGRYEPFVSEPTAIGPVADDSGRAMFYDDLTPYGEWVWIAGPGWVWSPHTMQAGWRPYTLGRWVFTDHGWTWASDEEFGWAVYHYGRWHSDATHGWVWVPGLEWGPAWVAWHAGAGWVGWAPIPWQVRWRAEVGLDWGAASVSLDPSWWCFAETRHLASPTLARHLAPPTRNVTLVRMTTNITNYTFIENRIVNSSVSIESVGKATGRSIPRYRVRHDDSPGVHGGGGVHEGEFVAFRPGSARSHEVRQDTAAPPAVRGVSGPARRTAPPAEATHPSRTPSRSPETPQARNPSHQHDTRHGRTQPEHRDPQPASADPDSPQPDSSKPAVSKPAATKPPAPNPAAAATGKPAEKKSKPAKSKADKPKDKKSDSGKSKDDEPRTDGS